MSTIEHRRYETELIGALSMALESHLAMKNRLHRCTSRCAVPLGEHVLRLLGTAGLGDQAFAAERRATVERIEKAFRASEVPDGPESFYQGIETASANLFVILAEEAG